MQESANGSTGWTDIADAEVVQITSANKTGEIAVEFAKRGASLRYIRVVLTPALTGGISPTVGVGAVVVLSNPGVGPTSNSTTAD